MEVIKMQIPFVLTLDIQDKKINNEVQQHIEEIFNGLNIKLELADSKKEEMVKDIISKSLDRKTGKIIWNDFWTILSEQCKEAHFEIIITDKGLKDNNTNFIYGQTVVVVNQIGNIIVWVGNKIRYGITISVKEIKDRCSEKWKECFLILTLHELGHFFGIPPVGSPNYIPCENQNCNKCRKLSNDERKRRLKKMRKSDLDEHHCNNRDCVMEQINVEGRLALSEKTYLFSKNKSIFCSDCQKAFGKNIKRFEKISEVILNRVFNG